MPTASPPTSPRESGPPRLDVRASAAGNAETPVPEVESSRTDLLRVGLLGANVWLVTLLIPVLAAGWGPLHTRLSAGAPLLVLGLGLAWLRRHPSRARWALLAGFVPLLGVGLVLRPDALAPGVYAAVSLSLAAVCLLAYVAAASRACSRPLVQHPMEHFPIVGRRPLAEGSSSQWVRAALLLTTSAGGFVAVVIVPALGHPEAWGDAGPEGHALTTVVGALASAGALAAIVGPGLRAERRRRTRRAPLRRTVLAALGLALVSALGWAALTYGNQL